MSTTSHHQQNDEHDFIASIFSSAVKTSLREKQEKNKKAGLKKFAPSVVQDPATFTLAAPPQQKQLPWVELPWVTVAGKRSKYAAALASAKVPLKTAGKKLAHSNNMYATLNKPVGPWKDTKAYRKKQRRNTRRKALREQGAQLKEQQQQQQAPETATIDVGSMSQDVESMSLVAVDKNSVAVDNNSTVSDAVESTSKPKQQQQQQQQPLLLELPYVVLTEGVLSFLRPEDTAAFSSCCKYAKSVAEDSFLWSQLFRSRFPQSQLTRSAMQEWKLAYQLSLSKIVDRLRCFSTKKTFFEDVLGVGVSFTVSPKTKNVDYIDLSQDLLSETAFSKHKVRADVFGNPFELFLPLYFSEEHFQRALPLIRKTIFRLCSPPANGHSRQFEPLMVLDVLPKIVNTFAVLLSDEGISASRKSFNGLLRIHRLFLALAHQYPMIKREALTRLQKFVAHEKYRTKTACPSLGSVLPLLMVVDEADFNWRKLAPHFLGESLDRGVLWACKKYPSLEQTHDSSGNVESPELAEKRVEQSFEAITVSLRLNMFHVYFNHATCRGTTTQERANRYDRFFGQPEPEDLVVAASSEGGKNADADGEDKSEEKSKVFSKRDSLSFSTFRHQINHILTVDTWPKFFSFVGLKCPSKAEMANRLRRHVKNSLRKKYHRRGMDFSRIHASGTSKILSKGQQYSASSDLRQVTFTDVWNFSGHSKYLDATCLLYKGKTRCHTVDYMQTVAPGVWHSGDMMRQGGGTHTIHIDLQALDAAITSCVFVISAWAGATLSDILSPSISFSDADTEEDAPPLCTYDLDAHDKISYLTSVIMCKLYRTRDGSWHVQAIGDAHKGAADNYGPIYAAVEKLL